MIPIVNGTGMNFLLTSKIGRHMQFKEANSYNKISARVTFFINQHLARDIICIILSDSCSVAINHTDKCSSKMLLLAIIIDRNECQKVCSIISEQQCQLALHKSSGRRNGLVVFCAEKNRALNYSCHLFIQMRAFLWPMALSQSGECTASAINKIMLA